ncbi:MAG: phosphatidate cytidylyltransferase, partial [Chloroflexota bacterium]|nr:phosphatidate cytidylyltransferase [Chloroflexota bacterium]
IWRYHRNSAPRRREYLGCSVRTRAISSIGVIFAGILPILAGGPIFALALGLLAFLAFREFQRLFLAFGLMVHPLGWLSGAAFAAVALLSPTTETLFAVVALTGGLTLVTQIWSARSSVSLAVSAWAATVAGALYLGLPVFAAIVLRSAQGSLEADWLTEIAEWGALGWGAAPRGMAWLLIIILATWLGDTLAYVVGRSFGRRPFFPQISPKKTYEGAVSGLIGSGFAGAVGVVLFGLGIHPLWGLLFGLWIGTLGQVGDLAESLLKRAANAKDSGVLIPGHGGVLDRIDSLLFAFCGGWLMATVVDRLAL